MPTAFATTIQNQEAITLSVNVNESLASTSIFLNGNLIRTIHGGFSSFYLGTNSSLKDNVVVVTTQVAKFPADMHSSTVEFSIEGAADVNPNNPMISVKEFQNAPNVPHFMTYYFI